MSVSPIFQNFPCPATLKTLLLNANKILAFDPNAFAGCNSLEELGVGANPFTFLPKDAFAGLNSLKRISVNTCPDLEIIQGFRLERSL
jgi:hypothetical protein